MCRPQKVVTRGWLKSLNRVRRYLVRAFTGYNTRAHREGHDATLREGEQFPTCTVCNDEVRFRLVQSAKLIDRDADFVGE